MSSLYSQQQFYSQPPYGGPSYSQNGYQHYFSPPPPPAPIYHDPATFRRDFSNRLAELTVNSRPIIQSLSMFAQDYVRFSEIVSQCLEAHIRRVPPWMKLPAFYLLDMISKNIYEPYARHFTSFLIPLFIETYQQVDDATRSKMVELVLTWRTGSPSGKELFGVPAQVSIERSVWGDGSGSQSSGFASTSGQITKAQVLSELEFTLSQKERALQANPSDSTSQNHVHVLQQLRRLVEAGVSQGELQQILGQLRSLMRSTTQVSPPPPPPSSAGGGGGFATPPQPPTISAVQPSWLASTTFSPPLSNPSTSQLSLSSLNNIKVENIASAPLANIPAVPAAGFADLLSSLLKSGVVSTNGTPLGAGATAKEEAATTSEVDDDIEALREHRASMLSHEVQLSTIGLTRTRPDIHSLLYDRLSAQCKQCGIRFPDTTNGKKEMEEHLDMHFRQNLKANQNIGRGHSRSWFIGADDWTHDSADVKGKGRADYRPVNLKEAAAAEAVKKEAELRAMFVVVPPGDEVKTIVCPVCKEVLSPEFVEDDEEWVWKNAVKRDDRIYHATCHAEASSSTNTLVARLRNDVSSRSRSATPERIVHPKQQTPPRGTPSSPEGRLAGIKRKAEDNSSSLSGHFEGTPPTKKVAIAAS